MEKIKKILSFYSNMEKEYLPQEPLTKILSNCINKHGVNDIVFSSLVKDKESMKKLKEIRKKTLLTFTEQLKLLACGYTITNTENNLDLYGDKWNYLRIKLLDAFIKLYL